MTPDKTTFILSTNRVYAMTEKIALADGRVDSDALLEGCKLAARRLIASDMAQLAEATNSVISAVLFGALAGSKALPMQRTAFEAAVAALRAERDGGAYRADYGSRLRDGAGLIALAAETGDETGDQTGDETPRESDPAGDHALD